MRRLALIAVFGMLLVGCGGSDEETAGPETVDTVATQTETGETETGDTETGETETSGGAAGDPAAGEEVFASNGCGTCHEFEPAGSSGTTGPSLDDLEGLAENAGQPVDEFTRESIENPDAYVEEGFPEGLMPTADLDDQELADLVAFLTQS